MAALTGLAMIPAVATPASAVGGDCDSKRGHQVRDFLPDYYRAEGKCTSLQSDSKARGAIVVTGPDSFTAWFYEVNKWKYGSWNDFIGTSEDGHYEEIRHL